MKRINALLLFSLALVSFVTAAAAQTVAPRPNVLVILTDDVGWGDYQCYNAAGKIPSPNVDRLAREGMRFTHALYEGDWKLITDIKDQPAALYDLKNDLAERHNLIADDAHAARVKAMEKLYREIRASKRSANTP